jgi:hypothetical protein
MVVLIVVVMLLAFGGAIAYAVKSKRESSAAAEAAGTGPNELLRAPPSSFPVSPPAATVAATPSERPDPPAEVAEVAAEPEAGSEPDDDDDGVASRFRSPGSRSTASPELLKPMAAARPVFHLEGEPEPVVASEPAEPVEPEPEIVPEPIVLADDEAVIDLVDGPAPADATAGAERAWNAVVLEAEADSVDHVLQALITRARFKQVGVEEVATELVERADLRGEDVSEVLAELVGRADGTTLDATTLDATPTSELTLFNDEVPRRPGQLTDFARLAPADKKRIIIRVLCLLVARSEDQQLPPRADVDGAAPKSWPLARAVWPLATPGDDDPDQQLPSRRLAKSG